MFADFASFGDESVLFEKTSGGRRRLVNLVASLNDHADFFFNLARSTLRDYGDHRGSN